MHPTIKFTVTISDDHIEYLDIIIFKGERFKESGILDIKMYTKLSSILTLTQLTTLDSN